MSDLVVDSSVVAKWILPESDSAQAQELIVQQAASSERLIVLDLVYCEVANAIWKRYRQGLISHDETRMLLAALVGIPVTVEAAVSVLDSALDIAVQFDRAVYDALFVALVQRHDVPGVTADQPLYRTVRGSFPQIRLLGSVA